MFLPLVAGVVGALVMGATKPRTAYEKMRALGSRSGITYEVEDFTSAGFIVVRAPDGTEGVLSRRLPNDPRGGGFDWSRGRGHPVVLMKMRADFGAAPGTAGSRPASPRSAPLPGGSS
jgi:hypothetical protein